MKKNTKRNLVFGTWLVVAILACLISNSVTAQPAPSTPVVNTDMVPWLVSHDATNKVVKKEQLNHQVNNGDTTFYDQKGNQIKKKDVIRWFPKFNNCNDERVYTAQKTANTALYLCFKDQDRTSEEADDLYRKAIKLNGKARWQFLDSLSRNSPRSKRLKALEDKDIALERRIGDLDSRITNLPAPDMSGFVEIDTFKVFRNETRYDLCVQDTMNAFLNIGLAAVDEQLSTTRGKHWDKVKVKRGMVQYFDWLQTFQVPTQVPKPATEQTPPKTTTVTEPVTKKSKRGAMPIPKPL